MSAAIHTRFSTGTRGSFIRAWTKDGKGAMALRVPYAYELHHSRRHPAAAKALAERLGWSGLWIVGHNEDNTICAVLLHGTTGETWAKHYRRDNAQIEGKTGFSLGRKDHDAPSIARRDRRKGRIDLLANRP